VISPNPGATYVQTAPQNFTLYGPVVTGEDGLYYHATDERVTVPGVPRNAVLFADALQALLLTNEKLGRAGM
jgi:hypothetical protein